MRIIEGALAIATLGLAVGLGSAIGFEGSRVEPAAIDCGPQTVKAGDAPKSMGTLQYAAEQGNAVAQWKLGHMYATGEGVPRCDLRAFEYFSRIANGHADVYPDAPQAPFVANAFVARGPRQAARWLTLAANKGQYQAQAVLGDMLFKGDAVPREAARGLMWLTLARDSAKTDDTWINELYDAAFKQANTDERALALVYLERWLKTRRD